MLRGSKIWTGEWREQRAASSKLAVDELVLEQPLEHADRGVERRHGCAVLRPAVPSTVAELVGEQASDDVVDAGAEVGAEGHRAAVDARLDLTVEVALAGVLPPAVLGDVGDRSLGRARPGLESEQLRAVRSQLRARVRELEDESGPLREACDRLERYTRALQALLAEEKAAAAAGSPDAQSIQNRLGWLDVGSTMPPHMAQVHRLGDQVSAIVAPGVSTSVTARRRSSAVKSA